MREWLARLADWFRREQLDRELADELRFHAEQLERDEQASGVPPSEAAWTARRRLGNLTSTREEARDRWSWPWLEQSGRHVRHALRGLGRSPGFTAAVVLTLGLGIGANTAMFSVVDRLMFRSFSGLRDPNQVHRVYLEYSHRGETIRNGTGHEYRRYLDLAQWSTRFTQFAGFREGRLAVGRRGESRERPVLAVSGSFFDFFEVRSVVGRFFGVAEDMTPIGAMVAVLGHDYWRTELGGAPDVIGRTIRVRNLDLEVIGVAPPGFVGVAEGAPPDVIVPITTYAGSMLPSDLGRTYYTQYNWGWMAMMARRAPGVSVEQASADLTAAYQRSWQAERDLNPNVAPVQAARPTAVAGPLRSAAGPGAGLESRTLLWVTGVAVIVLLIACANVANLMLARMIRRRRETALRLALGVSRGQLLARDLVESGLLATLGCLAGLALAEWGGAALRRLFVAGHSLDVVTDWRTLGVTAGFAAFAGIVTGFVPALLAGRRDLAADLRTGGRDGTGHRSRARGALLVAQAALSVVLLVGAGLFVRSLERVRSLRLGFDAERVLIASPNLRGVVLDSAANQVLGRRLLDVAKGLPGVERAALVSSVPFWSTSSTSLHVPGVDSVERLGRFTYQTATADYFATTGTRILEGRPFSETDRPGAAPVAVVSASMAAVLWPGRDAVGQCLHVGGARSPCTTVIGIAEDAIQSSLTETQQFRYYLPSGQYGDGRAEALLLRTRGRPADVAETARAALQREMPGDGYVTVQPLGDLVGTQQRSWKVGATMFAAFGALALVVAAVGLYGVIAYNVAQRMHELGIRTALGARGADLMRLVVRQGLGLAAAGTLFGLGLAALAAPWVEPLLFRQPVRDPLVYGGVGGLLFVVALLATVPPAIRATRADPNTVLHAD